jgi:hypothetical protein
MVAPTGPSASHPNRFTPLGSCSTPSPAAPTSAPSEPTSAPSATSVNGHPRHHQRCRPRSPPPKPGMFTRRGSLPKAVMRAASLTAAAWAWSARAMAAPSAASRALPSSRMVAADTSNQSQHLWDFLSRCKHKAAGIAPRRCSQRLQLLQLCRVTITPRSGNYRVSLTGQRIRAVSWRAIGWRVLDVKLYFWWNRSGCRLDD